MLFFFSVIFIFILFLVLVYRSHAVVARQISWEFTLHSFIYVHYTYICTSAWYTEVYTDLKINDSPICRAFKRCEFDNEADASLVSNILQSGDSTKWTSQKTKRKIQREKVNRKRECDWRRERAKESVVGIYARVCVCVNNIDHHT